MQGILVKTKPLMAHAGVRGLTRRVQLADGEEILRSGSVYRWAFLGTSPGLLTLTAQRLIWTPVPWPWGFCRWIKKGELKAATVHRNASWMMLMGVAAWALDVRTAERNQRFVFTGWPIIRPQSVVEDWATELQQWANLSA